MHQINSPELWRDSFPRPSVSDHKYNRGHALILGAEELTGATRLSAQACSRVGAGLVTVLASERGDIYRTTLPPDIMVLDHDKPLKNVRAVLGGCGGLSSRLKPFLCNNPYKCARVFDANAIPHPRDWNILDGQCVLTPHEGEFANVFGDIGDNREAAVAAAALESGAIVVLKGPQTIIAEPDGDLVINHHASPYLAKAGTGDVLAGMIAGLIAQGMPVFEASCCAVWMHGEAGIQLGAGLVAGDIEGALPAVIQTFA